MLLLILIGLLTWFLAYHYYFKRRNYPPGPTPLPFLGNLIELSKHEPGYEAYKKWSEEYGSVYTIWLGNTPVVVFSDYATMKESFVQKGELFIGKLTLEHFEKEYRGGSYGVIDTSGDNWKNHRRFALHQLKEFGMGTNLLEEKILREVEALTTNLKEHGTAIESMQSVFDFAVGSIINQLLFGYRFDESREKEFFAIKTLVSEQMRCFGEPSFMMIATYPVLRSLPYFKQVYAKMIKGRDEIFGMFNKQIEAHREELSKKSLDEEVTDYVEAYIREQNKREGEGDTESFCNLQLSNMCWDLWIAGLETTSNTLTWLVVYILHHPEVQMKIHEELDKVIGDERPITMADKNNLPYMNAVINESQRLANLVPMNLIHTVDEDYTIAGVSIKAGSGVVAQISNVLYDEKVFPKPYEFLPERFIDELGHLKKVDELVPFSIGKRQCLGEGLARMELFLFSANFFNRFKMEVDGELPSLKKLFGTTVAAIRSNCKVEYRF